VAASIREGTLPKQKYEEEARRFEEEAHRRKLENMHENRSMHIGDVRSSGIAGMRV
jgi:hypothetical protein